MTNSERLAYLFQRYLDRSETPEEWEELMALVENSDNKEAIEQALDAARPGTAHQAKLGDEQAERLFQAIRQQTNGAQVVVLNNLQQPRNWWRIAAAAAVIAALGIGSYYAFFNNTGKSHKEVVKVLPAGNDVAAPTTNKATITLADGSTMALDSLTTLTQGQVQVVKTANGQLVYSGNAEHVTYNTLSNPRGSRVIDMTLSDGSKVWLNAGSSITYPVAFVDNKRKVEMTGEAYFEVSHDAARPFIVAKEGMEVKVLGTHFNVNAYANEPNIKVTLLEGSVQVTANKEPETRNPKSQIQHSKSEILSPGQQAIINDATMSLAKGVNMDEVMAWKNGLFEFNETDIQTIMRQIERWYDVQVVFEGNVTQHFNGSVQRQENVSKVLSTLEKTGGVRFAIEGKKVLVKSY